LQTNTNTEKPSDYLRNLVHIEILKGKFR